MVSREYVEKVVYAPRKPIVRKDFMSFETMMFSKKKKKNPIRKDPVALTNMVPNGYM
ncbi:MAG TPA: hypothetical protein PKX40_06540 [Spirochaetota bacterium]|nr:hypothetical protein [Spirochaetota bacterium]